MNSDIQRDDDRQGIVSQQKHLSFYEENYILEPEDYEEDRGYFEYESDAQRCGLFDGIQDLALILNTKNDID